VQYGPSFRVVQELYISEVEALSRLELSAPQKEGSSDMVIHPAMLDGALQTVIGLLSSEPVTPARMYLPCSLAALEIYRPIPARAFAHAVCVEGLPVDGRDLRFDIDLYDENGRAVAALRALTLRDASSISSGTRDRDEAMLDVLRAVERGLCDEEEAMKYLFESEGSQGRHVPSRADEERPRRAAGTLSEMEFSDG
jgi:hypothetical protein